MVVEGDAKSSTGTVIRQGLQSELSPTTPQPVGHYSKNWISFLNENMWVPITDEEYDNLPTDREDVMNQIRKRMLNMIFEHTNCKSFGFF